jgi:hypothetical protein
MMQNNLPNDKTKALEELRAAIKLGMDEIEAGHGVEFDVDDIIKRGRERRAAKHINEADRSQGPLTSDQQ